MSIGVIDGLKVIDVKEQHICTVKIDTGKKQVISGAIVSAGQFIVRRFEIQTFQTALIDLIYLVISAGQIGLIPRREVIQTINRMMIV